MTVTRVDSSTETRVVVNRAIQLLEVFRTLNPDMPMGEAVSLLLIAQGETKEGGGLTVTELKDRGGFALASASRYMKSLSDKNRHGAEGHQLVTADRDPLDDRRKVLRLSSKGSRVIGQIKSAIGV
jgi:DNA-binding MarR family transcriptional regulator